MIAKEIFEVRQTRRFKDAEPMGWDIFEISIEDPEKDNFAHHAEIAVDALNWIKKHAAERSDATGMTIITEIDWITKDRIGRAIALAMPIASRREGR